MDLYGTNAGHGHVWERPDGMKAKCGGPGICSECSRYAAMMATEEEIDRFAQLIAYHVNYASWPARGKASRNRYREAAKAVISEMRAMDREKADDDTLGIRWVTEDELREEYPDSPSGT